MAYVIAATSIFTGEPVVAAVYLVSPDGAGDFPTIQAAVSFAGAGDVVELTDGVFRGDGNRDIDFLGKAITVRSQSGATGCVIDCEGSQSEHHRAFYFHSEEGRASVVAGITITGGRHVTGSAVCCDGASPTINDCVLVGNGSQTDTADGGALYCENFGSPLVEGCVFLENRASAGGAVSSCMGGFATLVRCTLSHNRASIGGAVRI